MYWYDGELISSNSIELSLDNPGLLYGATVFTTLRIYQQSLEHPLTNWAAHWQRLHHAIKTVAWESPNWDNIKQGTKTLISHFPVLRITLFPDGKELITGRNLPEDLAKSQTQGVSAWLAAKGDYTRSLPNLKTGNYLAPWLALKEAQKLGAKEAILVDVKGNWLESSTGNLWGWKNGCWYTPPLKAGILSGTMRQQLLNWLEFSQQPKQTTTIWDKSFVQELEAIAYTNSVVEVIPIHTISRTQGDLKYNPHHLSLGQLKDFFIANKKL
ncbi:MAG: aminotransferase class IV [Spirulinaceae cyanobacterium]